ncbi:MAG TPA: QueT transporter family protein [Bacilli bacterium]|nr:QueT transporter family protein [Bacilli bacterium]
MQRLKIRRITDNAIIAAVYAVMTILLGNFGYGDIQFRIAEILLFLVFFRRDFVIGIVVGTIIANSFSLLLPWDLLFGTLATLIVGVLIAITPKMWPAIIYATVINALVIGAELYFILGLPFYLSVLTVGAGELAVMIIGYFIFTILRKNTYFMNIIMAKRR